MISSKEEKERRFLTSCAYFAVITLIVWVVFKYLIGWLMPFILAFFISALVQPAVYALHKRLHINRRAAGLITVLMFIVIAGTLIVIAFSKIISELAAVSGMLPGLIGQFTNAVDKLSGRVSLYVNSLPVDIANRLSASLENMSGELMKLSSLSSGVISFLYTVIQKVPGLLLSIIITIVASCFMSMDYGRIRGFVLRQLPETSQEMVIEIKNFFFTTVAKLIRAYLTLMLITFTELGIGLSLFGVPHALAIAAVIAVVDILPVLGTGTVMIPWALIELITGNIYLALCLGGLYAFIAIVRNILEPKIVGDHIGLYPLITLISMFVGLQLFGVPGMFLFPIIAITLKHLQDTGRIRLWKD